MNDLNAILTERRPRIASQLGFELGRYIASSRANENDFNGLARRIFAYQWRFNAPYCAFCEGRNVSPENVATWRDIPAAPAAAFKMFALTCAPEEKCAPKAGGVTFHSSGTTQSETSRHFLDRTTVTAYKSSLSAGYKRFVRPDKAVTPILALMPPPKEAPHSSLSFMLQSLGWEKTAEEYEKFRSAWPDDEFPLPVVFFFAENWQAELARQLRESETPVTIFGTAFAFVHFFDHSSERFSLPAGSRIVETGGFKGKSREVAREDLYALFTERFGVPTTHCISEYGMSEMASQYYDSTLYDFVNGIPREPRKIAPPTLRTRIIDPVTNDEVAPGKPGLLIHFDLANLNSVMAIQTEDMGKWAEDGDGFHLLGRAPGAILRGCSLTAEEMAQSVSRRL